MAKGTIKRLDRERGFGFITPIVGRDLFFHRTAVQRVDFESLVERQRVEYEEENDPKDPSRLRAKNVRPIA